jgi:hypothetical protein
VSQDPQLTPELNKVLDALFASTGKTPELIYDADDRVVVEIVNQVRDKLAKEEKYRSALVWKYRKHK